METNLQKIGMLLAEKRKSLGLTQEAVGERIGVQKAMISKVENGNVCNIRNISRVAEALNVEPVVSVRPSVNVSKDMVSYVLAAISEFGTHYGLSVREASNYLRRHKGIDYLTEFYDVEHTLSFRECVDDLTAICLKNGGALR